MNPSTTFLLQLIGPVGLIVGVGLWVNPKFYQELMKSIEKEPLAIYLAGFSAMLVGLAIVLTNNFWNTPGEIIISLIGWLGFLKGVLFTLSPKSTFSIAKSMMKPGIVIWGGIFWVLLGAYLSWLGFFA